MRYFFYKNNNNMKLFSRKDYKLVVEPVAYAISAFKTLVDRDDTEFKTNAEKELAFIYLTCDPRSDLQFIVDESERRSKAAELVGMPQKFKIDKELKKAMDVYLEMTETSSSLLIKDLKVGVDKLRAYLRDADVQEDTFDKYVRALKELVPLSQKLADAEKSVIKEVEEISKSRGDKAMTLLDSGFDSLF